MATSATTLSAVEINSALNGLKSVKDVLYNVNELMEKYVNSESSLQEAIQKRAEIEKKYEQQVIAIKAQNLSKDREAEEIQKPL